MAAMYTENDEVFVLTRDAFGDYAKVHDRMPVLLEEDEVDMWINCKK
jgi:putative SOS response-associated peptidase YedK